MILVRRERERERSKETTLQQFKELLKELRGWDEVTRKLSSVELFFQEELLVDDQKTPKTLVEAGISTGAEVRKSPRLQTIASYRMLQH